MRTHKEEGEALVDLALLVEALARIDAKFALVWLVMSSAFAAIAHWSPYRVWWLDAAFAAWIALRLFWFGTAFRDMYRAVTRREEIEAEVKAVGS